MTRTKVEDLITSYIKSKWFTTEPKIDGNEEIPPLAQNNAKRIVIALIRKVIAPFINRSEDPEETIYVTFPLREGEDEQRQVIEVPARKMKSKEKLLGLRLCRAFNVIDPGYEYNAIKSKEILANPNSIIFGDTVVKEDQAMVPSRIRYSSSYSLRERTELTQKFTHNALSELGTMWDREKKKNRTSLFSTEYVKPGTLFPSFIVLDDPTPEALMHLLFCLKETTYGAQTSITGPNMENKIVGIMSCKNEPPVSSFTISSDWNDEKISEVKLAEQILGQLGKYDGEMLEGENLKEFLNEVQNIDENILEEAYNQLKTDSENICQYAGIIDSE